MVTGVLPLELVRDSLEDGSRQFLGYPLPNRAALD